MTTSDVEHTPLLEAFAEALRAVSGHPHIVRDEYEAADVVAAVLRSASARRVALSRLPDAVQERVEALCAERGIQVVKDPFHSDSVLEVLDDTQVGICGAEFGIAQTGTLVEVTTDDAHRLVSSLPRTYIGVVDARNVVPTFRDAAGPMSRVFQEHPEGVAISFVSGPSRTGDIELILTLGVHGPEVAHAIVITGEPDA